MFFPKPIYNEFFGGDLVIIDNYKALETIVFTFLGSYIVSFIIIGFIILYSFKINLFDISFKKFSIITPRGWGLKILFCIIWLSIGIVYNIIFIQFGFREIWFLKLIQVLITQAFVFYLLVRTNYCNFKILTKYQSKKYVI